MALSRDRSASSLWEATGLVVSGVIRMYEPSRWKVDGEGGTPVLESHGRLTRPMPAADDQQMPESEERIVRSENAGVCVLAHICAVRARWVLRGNNISATTRGGSLAPGPKHRAGQHEGRPKSVRPTVEDDALLDHHIEELLGTFGDIARMGERGPDTEDRLE